MWATRNCHQSVVEVLIKAGASQDIKSMPNIIEAAKRGNVAKVRQLLSTSDINGTDEVGDLTSLTTRPV